MIASINRFDNNIIAFIGLVSTACWKSMAKSKLNLESPLYDSWASVRERLCQSQNLSLLLMQSIIYVTRFRMVHCKLQRHRNKQCITLSSTSTQQMIRKMCAINVSQRMCALANRPSYHTFSKSSITPIVIYLQIIVANQYSSQMDWNPFKKAWKWRFFTRNSQLVENFDGIFLVLTLIRFSVKNRSILVRIEFCAFIRRIRACETFGSHFNFESFPWNSLFHYRKMFLIEEKNAQNAHWTMNFFFFFLNSAYFIAVCKSKYK